VTERDDVGIRSTIGALFCLAGVVWVLQGLNALHGSPMSGHGGYTVLGAVALVGGAALLAWAWRRRGTDG
jgi:drug/metabolite transporter (DMT)-like permease